MPIREIPKSDAWINLPPQADNTHLIELSGCVIGDKKLKHSEPSDVVLAADVRRFEKASEFQRLQMMLEISSYWPKRWMRVVMAVRKRKIRVAKLIKQKKTYKEKMEDKRARAQEAAADLAAVAAGPAGNDSDEGTEYYEDDDSDSTVIEVDI